MDVRRRNRIIAAVHALLLSGALLLLVWVVLQAAGRNWSMRSGPAAAVGAVVAAAFYLWTWVGQRRDQRELDALARETGIDPANVPEDPLPIIPRLPLAKERGELAAGVLFLALLAFVFVAYYAGWIGRW